MRDNTAVRQMARDRHRSYENIGAGRHGGGNGSSLVYVPAVCLRSWLGGERARPHEEKNL